MATSQVVHDIPFHSKFPASPNSNSSQPRMNESSRDFSPSQLEAKQILSKLLSTLKDIDSSYYPRYGKWIERHSGLEDICFQCVRPQVWTFLQGRWSLDALKTVGGDLRFEGRGVYLNGVLGLDRRVRIYVGQATSIRQRVAQHLNFRYRRDNPSLHYHAMQQSIYNIIAPLAILPSPSLGTHVFPGMDQPDLFLNVLEMWMALVFRSLPTETLEIWLNDLEGINKIKEGKEGQFGGLNIASPLDQGDKVRDWIDLSESDDPLVRSYLGVRSDRNKPEQIKSEKDTVDANVVLDTPAQRKKKYAETARRYAQQEHNAILVPQWIVFSGLAVIVGLLLFNSNSGIQPKLRGRFR